MIGRAATSALIAILAIAGLASGVFRPLDNGLYDLRFALAQRPATGSIVFVAIDSDSLRRVGVWPWPRRVYAQAIDRILDMGAQSVLLDIDFSSRSSEVEDGLLQSALERAGGYAELVAFRQVSPVSGALEVTLPLPRFAKAAPVAAVNVMASADGVIRQSAGGFTDNGTSYPSAAEMLSGTRSADPDFFIDYGIDLGTIDRVPIADVLDGRVAPARLAGKKVILGASAQELRDLFVVPRFGAIPGALLQTLAAETLSQHRALRQAGWLPGALIIVTFVAFFAWMRGRIALEVQARIAAAFVLALELMAYLAQARQNLLVSTVAIDLTLGALLVAAIVQELVLKGLQHAAAARERDASRRILDRVIADNFDGVLVVNSQGRVVAASRLAECMLSPRGAPLIGAPAGHLLPEHLAHAITEAFALEHPEPQAGILAECTIRVGEDERILEYAFTLSDVPQASRRGTTAREQVVCLTFRDITDRRRDEARLAYLAAHDPLTGALTRHKLCETMRAALSTEAGKARGLTLVLLDLGRLRTINDTLGHATGDAVLRQLAERLEGLGCMAVGRIGGDSFALMRLGIHSHEDALDLGRDVIAAAVAPYAIGDHRAVLSAHAGVTDTTISGFDADRLMSHADMAVSAAKAMRGNGCALFDPAMDRRMMDKQQMEVAMRQSHERREFGIAYQPQCTLGERRPLGVEALMRWRHPQLGEIPPSRFIPLAEETGLIVDLGCRMLEAACTEVASWPAPLTLAVNVSAVQFELGDIVGDVVAALDRSGLDPGRLELEITESVLVASDGGVLAALEKLRGIGVTIALDDFGTGYSSLSYLGRLPIDKIKIDQSFVRPLPDDAQAEAVVETILSLAHTLGKTVVAEGIETPAQADLLERLGCDIGQGYLFGRPGPSAGVRALGAPHPRTGPAPARLAC